MAEAPEKFTVEFETSKGTFRASVNRDWAPHGVDRFHSLVESGYFSDIAFFRVLKGFVAQFGIHGDPAVGARWRANSIPDDPVTKSNRKGTITFATAGPDTRTTQLFINLEDNGRLDGMGFAPFAEIVEGMEIVESLYDGYGEGSPRGNGPDQGKLQSKGNAYLRDQFPKLDYLKAARVVEQGPGTGQRESGE